MVEMFRVVLVTVLVVAVNGRQSPNADYVKEFLKTSGGRFSDNIIEDALLDVPGLIEKYGYPVEVHSITTEDNYILEVHRIPHGRDENNQPDSNKPVVFMMHGLISSSAEYLVLGPGNALAYLLAEAGYDVWLGNARGNFYSRNHVYLNPDGGRDVDFWRFSWDEIGYYDLPATIDHILETTGQSRLHYIGHSQGCTVFFVLNSLRPEYNEKFISFQALAPAAFFVYNADPTYTVLAPYEAVLEDTAFRVGLAELLGNREFFQALGVNFCYEGGLLHSFCVSLLYSGDLNYFNTTMTPLILGHAPAGASLRQFAHYGQGINTHLFRRYNDLPIRNIERYGRPTPPHYDLTKITAPNYLHYSLSDVQADYRDILYLSERLPNVAGLHQVERPSFNHVDFVWATDVKEQLYDLVMELMKQAEEV